MTLHLTANQFIQQSKKSASVLSLDADIGCINSAENHVWFKCILIWVKQIHLLFICSMKSKLYPSSSQFNNIFCWPLSKYFSYPPLPNLYQQKQLLYSRRWIIPFVLLSKLYQIYFKFRSLKKFLNIIIALHDICLRRRLWIVSRLPPPIFTSGE